MAVCRFFLKGQCRFGDGIRNEGARQSRSGDDANDDQKITLKLPFFNPDELTARIINKSMWPLSSCKVLGPGLDESPEELRVKAVAAMASGNINIYIAMADQIYTALNARNISAQLAGAQAVDPFTSLTMNKPTWPLSSDELLVPGLDKSLEELRIKAVTAVASWNISTYVGLFNKEKLRVKAVAAVASWNISTYLAHEKQRIAEADQLFAKLNARRNTSAQANGQAVKQSELPSRLAAVTNAQTTISSGENGINSTTARAPLPATFSEFFYANTTTPPSNQSAFGSMSGQSASSQPSFSPAAQNSLTLATLPTSTGVFTFGQRLRNATPVVTSDQTPGPATSSVLGKRPTAPGQLAMTSSIKLASEAFRAPNNTRSTGAFAAQTARTTSLVFGQTSFGEPVPATSVRATSVPTTFVPATSIQQSQQAAQQEQQQQTAPVSPFSKNFNARINSAQANFGQAIKQSELPARLEAVINAQTTIFFENNGINSTSARIRLPTTSSAFFFRSTQSAFREPSFGQANPLTLATSPTPTGVFTFGQRLQNVKAEFTFGRTPSSWPATSSVLGQQRSALGQLATSSSIKLASKAFRTPNNTRSTGAFTARTANLVFGQTSFGEPVPATSVRATSFSNTSVPATSIPTIITSLSGNPAAAPTSVRGVCSVSGVQLDNKEGISKKALSYFHNLDKSVGEHTLEPDQTISGIVGSTVEQAVEQAILVDQENGYSKTFQDYFLQAITSPLGQQLRMFYTDASKQVQDIHEEALSIFFFFFSLFFFFFLLSVSGLQ